MNFYHLTITIKSIKLNLFDFLGQMQNLLINILRVMMNKAINIKCCL